MTQNDHGSSYGSELDTQQQEKLQQFTMNGGSGGGHHSHPHEEEGAINGAKKETVDAGLASLDHYRLRLSKWRYKLRAKLLPLVRWETPYLAYMQDKMRTPALDRYFAITANLGTHTFFMIFLPILFWCGWPGFGKGLTHILAEGVFFTGYIKDMLCLPRPLSPPLHRITMSGSVALEYGFPSTHSANAVSAAVYGILVLHSEDNIFSATTTLYLEVLLYCYTLSIIIGRLYCGMHGFLDVVFGSLLGAAISLVEYYYYPRLEAWEQSSTSYFVPFVILVVIVVLVRIHPEPVDDCPCFDDSVAFAGVIVGVEAGTWRFAQHSPFRDIYHGPEASFDLAAIGWPVSVARVLVGVVVIFAWREVTKPTLHKTLPHLFRLIEKYGLDLPRRFFLPASAYKQVPGRLRDDSILPSVSDFGKVVNSIRGPTRGRAVSVGPQSAADAYETLAYRERRRRESLDNEEEGLRVRNQLGGPTTDNKTAGERDGYVGATASGVQSSHAQQNRLKEYESQMGTGTVVVSPPSPEIGGIKGDAGEEEPEIYIGQQDELGAKEMFSRLVKPRVRYDVEVVTKLVVYAGIGFLAVDGMPTLFEFIGLGAGHLVVR